MSNIFSTVTTEQFKEYYFRDFPFLPYYINFKAYKTGDIVFYDETFYKSLTDNNTALPTDTEVWEVTTGDKYSYVTDEDISKAITQAQINANERFGNNCQEKVYIFLHLVAFYLVMDLKNSSAGINSAYSGLVASKSVGDVSESYNFPQWVVNSPLYSIYSQNGYGMKYLSLIVPYLSVTILFSNGRTTFG
jgi:hypothetical protein